MTLGTNETDIYNYPAVINPRQPNECVTCPDLDGNAVKLLHFAVKENILSISRQDYDAFVQIYRNGLNANNIDNFKSILSRIAVKENAPAIRLDGDDFADRGQNDYLTLKLFECMDKAKVKFDDDIVSNHGTQFLLQYIAGFDKPNATIYNEYYGRSLHNCMRSIKEGIITAEEMNLLVQKHYLPKLKMLSYELDKDNNTLLLYSHAPVTSEKIYDLAAIFLGDRAKCVERCKTPQGMADLIDDVNKQFAVLAQDKNTLYRIINSKVVDDFVNDRYADVANKLAQTPNDTSFNVVNIHGHVATEAIGSIPERSGNWSYVNIDGNLGKKFPEKMGGLENNIGQYTPYISQQTASMRMAATPLKSTEKKEASPATPIKSTEKEKANSPEKEKVIKKGSISVGFSSVLSFWNKSTVVNNENRQNQSQLNKDSTTGNIKKP